MKEDVELVKIVGGLLITIIMGVVLKKIVDHIDHIDHIDQIDQIIKKQII
jgi:uncharacterized membrane protein